MFRTALFLAAALSATATAFYVPGIEPISYNDGDTVAPLVNGLHSTQGILAYPYYAAPFCRPQNLQAMHETLGEILMGDRFETGSYLFNMKKNVQCKLVQCTATETAMTAAKLKALEKFIDLRYRGWLALDNLPAFNNGTGIYGGCRSGNKADKFEFTRGYALGVTKECTGKATLVNNHLQFRIQYHTTDAGEHRVVGFTVVPFSIDHQFDADGKVTTCGEKFNVYQMAKTPVTTNPAVTKRMAWSYSVEWVEEPTITWASRWDSYLRSSFADSNNKVHWFAIVNSLLVVFSLAFIAFIALVRSLRRDFAKYNEALAALESEEAAEEEAGWKLVSNDVLRAPTAINSLVVGVATGTQILGMVLATLFFACLGFLSPANRGGLVSAVLLTFVALAFVAGYVAARMLNVFSQKSWMTIFYTGLALPALMFGTYIFVIIVSATAKSIRTPIVSLLTLMGLWLLISLPLLVLGAAYGFSVPPPERKGLRVSDKVRPVPDLPWHLEGPAATLLAGMIPLAGIFVELRFILASLWQGMVYYVFGFLALTFVLWLVCCALVSVVVTYHRLCGENYHWWWVAFFAPSGAAVPLVLYVMYYYATQMTVTTTAATLVYMSYMSMGVMAYVLIAGAVGFTASYFFVLRIFSAIKMD